MQYGKFGLGLCIALATVHGMAHEASTGGKAAAQKSPLPARKSGLWEVTVRSDDLVLKRQGQVQPRPQTVQMCTNAEAEPVMLFAIVPAQENCREVKASRRAGSAGGGFDITTVCHVHETRADARMELRGDLQRAYSGAFSVSYPQAPMGNTGRMLFEGRWLGQCKPGQRPGDMVLPNGVTVNVVDDKRRAEEGGHEGHDHKH